MSKKSFTLLGLCLVIYLVACSGTTSTPLVNTPSIPVNKPVPVAVTATKVMDIPESGVLVFYSDRDGNPEIYSINADGTGLLQLTNDPGFDDSPAISPDGRQIIFLTARHDPQPRFPNLKYEIYIMDIDGGNLKRLTNSEAGEDHPSWSPDGSQILFDADYDGDGFYEIYSMDQDGTNVTRLTTNAANDQFADWSPDGLRISFASDRNGNWDIFVMDADGSNQQALTGDLDWELFPAWSPDGSQIAFTGLAPNSRNTDVFLMNADGTGFRQLTDSPGFDENPAFSPDGVQIAFQTQRGGNFEIYLMNPDGSGQHPLFEEPSDELWPSWVMPAIPPTSSIPDITFMESDQDLGLAETVQVCLGDLDGDGDLDAVFADPMKTASAVWLNDGFGGFVDTGQELTKYGHGVGLADLDGDGDLDAFIVTHQFSLPSRIYLNDGKGSFQDSGQDLGDSHFSAVEVNLVDINGDGFVDAHVVYYDPSGLPDKVNLNAGDARFSDSGLLLEEDGIAWGDLDGDGDLDYFGKHFGQGYLVMLNDGSGNFSPGWQLQDERSSVGGIALADFDADGDLDALLANGYRETGSYPSLLFLNDGNGNFSDSDQALNETLGADLALGDLDGDGDPDVFVTNMDLQDEIWLNVAGKLLDSGLRLGKISELSGKASLGDLDGDGDLDVVVGRFRGGAQIWFNFAQ